MTEQPKCVVSDDELRLFIVPQLLRSQMALQDTDSDTRIIDLACHVAAAALQRFVPLSVEKALAEQEARALQDFLGWKDQEEARHQREVERARLGLSALLHSAETYMGYHNEKFYGGRMGPWDGLNPAISEARAELAALTSEPQAEGGKG